MSVLWRPEMNAMTNPPSYWARVIAKDSVGYRKLAEQIVLKNPVCSVDQAEAVLRARDAEIMEQLLEGNQVTLENAFTYRLTISAKMDAPDDPLPPNAVVNVQVYAARTYSEALRQKVVLERRPPDHKTPVIAGAEDTVLRLKNVLNPYGALRLTGTEMAFDINGSNGECVIEGTNDGRIVQTRFAVMSNSMIAIIPEVPEQSEQWNNEYRVSISTRYTPRGSLRTGIYPRLLRTPLAVSLGQNHGILSGSEASPLARVTGGQLNATSERTRVEAVFDAQSGELRLRLLDMREGGATGDAVRVTGNGLHVLPGWTDSPLLTLNVTVDNYAALLAKVREEYTGRLVDILDVDGGA